MEFGGLTPNVQICSVKALMRWALRHVPRPLLHRLAVPLSRLVAFLLQGQGFEDPVDGRRYKKLLPYGRVQSRANALAPASLSLERHRLLWLYLHRATDFFSAPLRVLHIAPEWCFLKPFRRLHHLRQYVTADLESPWADVHIDIHAMPFDNASFDVVLCNHVLEHVADDRKALAEIFRVLAPGGWAILQSPVDLGREITFEDPTVTDPRLREKLFGQDDHVRLYGRDYPERIRQAGFIVEVVDFTKELSPDEIQKYALPAGELIYKAIKPCPPTGTELG
ncbi:MAG: methyltransferase domain-containing protein [Flavobacteriales bacterium]|nr:methyltransferase domain-containing protein [Flavobacteriales bacterium]